MEIRYAKPEDEASIHGLYFQVFAEDEREAVARLACELLIRVETPADRSFVATVEGRIVGHVAFSPVALGDDSQGSASILAPLAVAPEFQKRGMGSALVQHGLEWMRRGGLDLVFVYGDPNYYERFGFSAQDAEGCLPEFPLQYPFGWQGLRLGPFAPGDRPCTVRCVEALRKPELW